jgi:uncharacterized protein GlcG (DUF336 family)
MSLLSSPPTIGRTLARLGTDAAIVEAQRTGFRVCVAVVDATGHLISFERMDGAPFQTIEIAKAKALSVAGNHTATHEYWQNIADQPWLIAGVQSIQGLSLLGGGVPVMLDDQVIGAVGVSGKSSMAVDQALAEVAVRAIAARLAEESA